MAIATVIAKKWGNSIGIIIPKEIVEKEGIKLDKPVQIEVKPVKSVLAELFGTLKTNKSTEQILKEFRKDFESKYM
ncbi:AbrB/MazE/SpoVT family DNA-binding domain-containing protein [Candidatus Woesearchaeota archaeon]|nr:AbrB/MazE/SpoVT family DNA-binding domain-containing protein [Candidatus Woesearchaeota archaeon]